MDVRIPLMEWNGMGGGGDLDAFPIIHQINHSTVAALLSLPLLALAYPL